MLYVRFRYGIDLRKARPDKAIAKANVPILLIHGQADNETTPENSIRLAHANPAFTRLWLVPGAKHTGAYEADPKAFEQKVLKLF
jgi:pimeloyl-ACP methyl ester carboxylesterase